MPIIVKNNKKYGGTYSNATDVNYDNSVSKLNAGTSQEALDELADGLKNTSPVDNLLSTSTTLPLSANQGRVLDEKIITVNDSLNGFETYGVGNLAIKILKVGKQRVMSIYGSGSVTANTTLFTLANNNRPKSEVMGIVTLMASSGTINATVITIATNGNVTFSGDVSNKYMNAVLVYETN